MVRLKGTHYFIWRYRVVTVVVLFFFTAVAARAVHLHVFEGEFLRDEGKNRFLRFQALPSHRGIITDRHGRPLAISTPVSSIIANPALIFESQETVDQFQRSLSSLAECLGQSEASLFQRIHANQDRSFLYLKRHMPPGEVEAFFAAHSIEGIDAVQEYKRYYPASDVAAHLVGFTDIDDRGQEGLELAYDQYLKGTPGKKRVIKDRRGRVVKDLGLVEPPQAGADIQLSIDLRMQHLAYKALQEAVRKRNAAYGSLVALDARTGEVLALVNEPSFNPNYRLTINPDSLRNRAITDAIEPGSTVKPFTVAVAMEAGLVLPYTPIDTSPGYMPVGRKLIKDFRNYGLIDVTTILTKSSNVGATKLALQLPQKEQLAGMFSRVGFGEDSGSTFPGETLGLFPVKTHWRPLDLATLSYGYGVSVNLLQLARAYSVLANNGLKMPISLLKNNSPSEGFKVLEPALAETLTGMLETVVTKEGTASRAKVAGYRVAGKTGTVLKLGDAGYTEDEYRALFVGYAPATRPELVVAVVVDDPKGEEHGGGEVAAPIFAKVMAGLLRLSHSIPDGIDARTAMKISHEKVMGL